MPRRFHVLYWAIVLFLAPLARPAAAGAPDEFECSLAMIPDNTGLYVAVLRSGAQIDAVRSSRAWAKLWTSPAVTYGWDWLQSQAARPTTAAARLAAAWHSPYACAQVERLAELCAQEVFVWVDRDALASLRQVQPPRVIVGFRITDPDSLQQQLDAVGLLCNAYSLMNETWRECFKQEQIGPGRYLVFTLDSRRLLHSEQAHQLFERFGGDARFADVLGDLLPARTLVLAVGIRKNYLLISVGEATAALARLGSGKRLVDRPEMKPLLPFAKKRLTGILYVAGERPAAGVTFWEGNTWEGYLSRRIDALPAGSAAQPSRVWHWKPDFCPPEYDLAAELLPAVERYVERRLTARAEPSRQARYHQAMTAVHPWIAGFDQIHTLVKLLHTIHGITAESRAEDGFLVRRLRVELGDIE